MKKIYNFPNDNYTSYLSDESCKKGDAKSISFPTNEEEIKYILSQIGNDSFIVQGQRTGFKGSCVPHGQHIINMSEFTGVTDSGLLSDGTPYITVNAGTTLESLNMEILRLFGNSYFWPPSPTEKTASIGGIAASGAKGMNYLHYGDVTDHIEKIYTLAQSQIITRIKVRLSKKPPVTWGLVFFFSSRDGAASFCDKLAGLKKHPDAFLSAAEYFDPSAVDLLNTKRESVTVLQYTPHFPAGTEALVYIEISTENDGKIETLLFDIMDIASASGSDPNTAWALTGESECEKMHKLRHCVTEISLNHTASVNASDSRMTFPSLSISGAPGCFSEEIKALITSPDISGLPYVICAKPVSFEIEVYFLPSDYKEFTKCIAFTDKCKERESYEPNNL